MRRDGSTFRLESDLIQKNDESEWITCVMKKKWQIKGKKTCKVLLKLCYFLVPDGLKRRAGETSCCFFFFSSSEGKCDCVWTETSDLFSTSACTDDQLSCMFSAQGFLLRVCQSRRRRQQSKARRAAAAARTDERLFSARFLIQKPIFSLLFFS